MPYARTIHSFEIRDLKAEEPKLAECEQLLLNFGAKSLADSIAKVRRVIRSIVNPDGNDFREELPSE